MSLPAQTVQEEIEATFTPWEKDPVRISRLLRWLEVVSEAPNTISAIAAFIEDPTRFSAQYAEMCILELDTPSEAA
jgi:hypothetical protein